MRFLPDYPTTQREEMGIRENMKESRLGEYVRNSEFKEQWRDKIGYTTISKRKLVLATLPRENCVELVCSLALDLRSFT